MTAPRSPAAAGLLAALGLLVAAAMERHFYRDGAIAAPLIVLVPAAAFVWRRGVRSLSADEIGLLWFAAALPLAGAAFILFWNIRLGWPVGRIAAALFVLGSAAALAGWRRATLGGVERAMYWLGCSLTAAWLSYLADAFGSRGGLSLAAAALPALAAVAIAWRRRARIGGGELAIYWCGSAAVLTAMVPLSFHAMEWRPATGLWIALGVSAAGGWLAHLWWWRKAAEPPPRASGRDAA